MNARTAQADGDGVGHFEFLEPGAVPRHPVAVPCVVGRDLVIRPDELGDYCLKALPPRVDDLLLVAGAVAFVDRAVRRRTAKGWERRLHLVVPVLDPDFWADRRVSAALLTVLRLLTGDAWHFEFARRRSRLAARPRQERLPFGDRPAMVLPFSDGLDSLAVARLTAAREPHAGLVLVTVGRLRDPDTDWRIRHFKDRYHRVRLPFAAPRRESKVRFREASYRSRAFLFGVASGIAAGLLGTRRALVAESGQGSLGPALTSIGNEVPDVRMHPTFTAALSDLLTLVLGQRVRFEHPRMWCTKGETLKDLVDARLSDDWQRTRSCPRDARDLKSRHRIQCGVCASCLLRRQSLAVAGLGADAEEYQWPRLSARDLSAAAVDGARPTRRNDERHAACGALAMAEFAALARRPDDDASLRLAEDDLATALDEPPAEIRGCLRRLLSAHRAEWEGFVSAQGDASFLARLAALAPA